MLPSDNVALSRAPKHFFSRYRHAMPNANPSAMFALRVDPTLRVECAYMWEGNRLTARCAKLGKGISGTA